MRHAVDITPRLSAHFSLMSIFCAMLVVTIHAGVAPHQDTWQWYVMRTIDRISDIAVPYFFAASAFFLTSAFVKTNWYWPIVRKKIRTLIVPFFAWLIIYELINVFLHLAANTIGASYGAPELPCDMEWLLYLVGLHPFKLVPIVWFLRSLFMFALLSPIFVHLNRGAFIAVLAMFFGLYFIHDLRCLNYQRVRMFFEYFFSIKGFFYFSFGIFLRRFLINIAPCHVLQDIAIAALAITCLFISHWGVVSVFVVLVASWLLVGKWHVSERWANISRQFAMPIFLIHLPIIVLITCVASGLGLKQYVHTSITAFVLKWVVAISGSVLISVCARRFFPRAFSVLMGGR